MKRAKILPFAMLLAIGAGWLTWGSSPTFAASTSFKVSTCLNISFDDPQACYRPSEDASGMSNDPIYVQETEAQTCATWHISIDGAKPFDGCAEHMGGSNVGDYILLGPNMSLSEYRITALANARRNVAVQFVQKWIPDGTEHHPFLLLLYEGMCSDVWSVEGIGTDPLCTITMPIVSKGQYVEVAGAGLSGEFLVQTVNLSQRSITIE